MTLWHIVLAASIACVALKLAGYSIPPRVLEKPVVSRVADLMTVAMLAALIVVQALGDGQAIVVDARLPALVVAAGLLAMRAPFLVVVIAAAVVAALLRMAGMP
ncbi:AzlD domain-containing protein [Paramicrobacterium agarici]|uniref:Branched-subunit amino acid transport protein AzlD n=1 Tax=Paramicrobacterium agarici TaxID=630514 RepID=A0A2A9DZB8_9MICO|nr:AzlD domain-containing protein [Microbacterium agarici]PFG31671.1 branched-subunit amino acid transport protein AzlD [Microbacterium agarici]TQO21575.1 branched-subunit amino acid transport protein AzlD [Microbacterium agarici]